MNRSILLNSKLLLTFALAIVLAACAPTPTPPPGATNDTITLIDNDAGDDAVLLFDGRRGGVCENDTLLRTSGVIDMTSVESSGSCNDELTIFSDDDAALFTQFSWNDFLGDFEYCALLDDDV